MQAMKYKINEIFSSWQGEGFNTGMPATFVRLSGCNLSCDWCDTRHSAHYELSTDEIIAQCQNNFVILTGGEPTMQNIQPLVYALKQHNKTVGIETNGLNEIPVDLDWVAIAPKEGFVGLSDRLKLANEVKLVVTPNTAESYIEWAITHSPSKNIIWLQPEGNKRDSMQKCMQISNKYGIRIGHQMHKIRGWQ